MMDRAVGHVTSITRIGTGVTAIALTVIGLLVGGFGSLQVFLIGSVYDLTAKYAEQTVELSDLRADVVAFTAALKDAPAELKSTSAGLSSANAELTRVVARLDQTAKGVETATSDFLALKTRLDTIETKVNNIEVAFTDPKGQWTTTLQALELGLKELREFTKPKP
jgi:flagellin-like hook-associated protein FlgL